METCRSPCLPCRRTHRVRAEPPRRGLRFMTTPAELLATGFRWHQAGDLPRAENAYRQLVQQDPGNAQAWYLLGALSEARGDLAAATTNLEQALRLRPAFAEALHHQGIVCARQGHLAEAAS